MKMSRVTWIILVLWIGNDTLHKPRSFVNISLLNIPCMIVYVTNNKEPWTLKNLERPLGVPIVWSPYRITAIHWLMARMASSTFLRCLIIPRTCHLLLKFLCRKGPCLHHEELGSKRSISFPIERTRVTRVTQDVFYHRFTQRCVG